MTPRTNIKLNKAIYIYFTLAFFVEVQDLMAQASDISKIKNPQSDSSLLYTGFHFGNGQGGIYTNTAFGQFVLKANSTGQYNSAGGFESLSLNSTGNYNTTWGYYGLRNNTIGYANSSFGAQALFKNVSGYYNLAAGVEALRENTTGYQNTALGGYDALHWNTTGANLTAVGSYAMYHNITGNSNTGIGQSALFKNTTGNALVALGLSAGEDNTSGSYNTYVGYMTGKGITSGNNNTIIGSRITLGHNQSNHIIIGDGAGVKRIWIDSIGNVGIGDTIPKSRLHVTGDGISAKLGFRSYPLLSLIAANVKNQGEGSTIGFYGTNPNSLRTIPFAYIHGAIEQSKDGDGGYLSFNTVNSKSNTVEESLKIDSHGAVIINNLKGKEIRQIHVSETGELKSAPVGHLIDRLEINDQDVKVTLTNYMIAFIYLSKPTTVELPENAPTNKIFIIKDESGFANKYPISIKVSGNLKTLDGKLFLTLNSSYGCIYVYYSGRNYFTIN